MYYAASSTTLIRTGFTALSLGFFRILAVVIVIAVAFIVFKWGLGWIRRITGTKTHHGFRHRKAQMNAISRGRFDGRNSRFGM